ncbi:MAG: hypothetical protein V4555_20535 [Acidobacteriota bacterium]
MHIAALKLGTDPVAPLPPATFHRTLEEHLYCPKCNATYVLMVDYDWAVSRHFEEESRRHLTLLRKTIFRGHSADHRITHFETNGVVVTAHVPPDAPPLAPLTRLLQ